MNIETVTYKDVIDGYKLQGDTYGLGAYALEDPRRSAFLSNPNLNDTSKIMLKLMRHEGIIIGRSMMFPSRFKAADDIIETVGGSALEVAEQFRGGEAGGGLMAYNIRHKENNAVISSGFSSTAAKCHKALRAYMLCFPQFVQIKDYRRILPKIGLNSMFSFISGGVLNCLVWPLLYVTKRKAINRCLDFKVERVDIVPEWVDDIVLNDGHKYMEVHDHKWLQWTLDNMFHSHERNVNSFYTISRDGENLGFFMIKERFTQMDDKHSFIGGTICEWGTKDPIRLSEYDLHLMAISKFSKFVDIIFMATPDEKVGAKMKRLLFFRKGDAKIAFYDLKKQYREAKNIDQWRVRYGYGDSILN